VLLKMGDNDTRNM